MTSGALLYIKLESAAVARNKLGDGGVRNAIVYLPPGYDENPTRRYPTVYLLHGYGGNSGGCHFWVGGGYIPGLHLLAIVDPLVCAGAIQPMVLVCPDGSNRYWGSMYEDSVVSGGFATFVCRELVAYVDRNFRTMASPQARGIGGHSMGGQGAMKLAMCNPDVFGAVYAMSGMLAFNDEQLLAQQNDWLEALSLRDLETLNHRPEPVQALFALMAAFTPNPDRAPFLTDFPVCRAGSGIAVEPHVARRFHAAWPAALVDEHQAALRILRAIAFDVGLQDSYAWGIEANRTFARALRALGVPHRYEEYAGTHTSHIRERFVTRLLPFFSAALTPAKAALSNGAQQHDPERSEPLQTEETSPQCLLSRATSPRHGIW